MSIKAFFVKVHHTTFEDLRVIFIYTFTVKKKLLIFIFSLSNLQKRLPLVPISTSFSSIFVLLEHDVKCNLRMAKLLIAKLCVCGVGWLGAPNSGRLFTTSFSWAAKMHRKLSFYFISGEVETSNVAQNLIDFLNLRVRRKLLVNVQWC